MPEASGRASDETRTYAAEASAWKRGADDTWTPVPSERKVKPPPVRTERTFVPVAPATLHSQWATPLAISLTSMLGVAVLSYPVLAFVVPVLPVIGVDLPSPGGFALAIGGGVWAWNWFEGISYFREQLNRTKEIIEPIVGRDLTNDGHIGKPPPAQSEPGWIDIDGDRVRRNAAKSEALKKREAVLRFVELIWFRQLRGAKTGQKAMRGHQLPHGYRVTDPFHQEIGDRLTANGLASPDGKSWRLDATPEEVAIAMRAWDN